MALSLKASRLESSYRVALILLLFMRFLSSLSFFVALREVSVLTELALGHLGRNSRTIWYFCVYLRYCTDFGLSASTELAICVAHFGTFACTTFCVRYQVR